MKKLFTIAAFSLFVFSTYAQDEFSEGYKPVKGTITTEVGLAGGLNDASYNLNSGNSGNIATAPVLRFRYFLKNDLGLRLGFSARNKKTENSTGTGATLQTTTLKNSGFDFNVGVEKHFKGSDRLSTYAGADILFGSTGASAEIVQANGDYDKVTGSDGTVDADNSIGLRLFTGADYYIAKKVYLGVELGLNITSGKTKEQVIESKTGNTIVSVVDVNEGKKSGITPSIVGGVRLGYQF